MLHVNIYCDFIHFTEKKEKRWKERKEEEGNFKVKYKSITMHNTCNSNHTQEQFNPMVVVDICHTS